MEEYGAGEEDGVGGGGGSSQWMESSVGGGQYCCRRGEPHMGCSYIAEPRTMTQTCLSLSKGLSFILKYEVYGESLGCSGKCTNILERTF